MRDKDDYYELKAISDKNKQRNEDRYREVSKKKLMDSVATKMRTIMIGALAKMEAEMGYLWGDNHDKPLSKFEQDMQVRWQNIRNHILDLGNNNIRAVEQELAQYNMTWERYKTDLIIRR
jgi:hypothetical protein